VCVQCTYMDELLPGSVGQRGRQQGAEGLQSWGAGCRSGNKCQRSAYSVCVVYVHGRAAPGKCRGSKEGGKGRTVYRAGARAVGQATSVSGAQIVCVQCKYMDDSPQGSVGWRGRRRGADGLQSWGAGCRSGDKRQRNAYSMCTMYVHGRLAPGECRAVRKAVGGKVYSAGVWAVDRATSVSGAFAVCVQCTYVEKSLPGSVGAARRAARGRKSTELRRGL